MSCDHDATANKLAKKYGTKHRHKGVDIVARNMAIEVACSIGDVYQSLGQLKRSRARKKYMAVPRSLVQFTKGYLKDTGIGVMTPSGKIRKRSRRRKRR